MFSSSNQDEARTAFNIDEDSTIAGDTSCDSDESGEEMAKMSKQPTDLQTKYLNLKRLYRKVQLFFWSNKQIVKNSGLDRTAPEQQE